MKKYVIITASDAKYGDFLANHWLRSLTDNVDLKNIDIVILDYGLTREQKNKISNSAKIIKCKNDGHIVNIRYRDILNFLNKNHYKQILLCDGGDIIFQRDISRLFEKDKNSYRAVCEVESQAGDNIIEFSILNKSFSTELSKEIIKVLANKRPINGGLFLGPYEKIKKICVNIDKLILNRRIYGPDQVILNYTLYKEGFKELGRTFNYTLFSSKITFNINKGVFFDNKEKIFIVHNSGNKNIFRIIKNFGYGENYNNVKWLSYLILKYFYKIFNLNLVLKSIRKMRIKE